MDDGTVQAAVAAGEESTPAVGVVLLTLSFCASAGILVWLALTDVKRDGARDQSMLYVELFVVFLLCSYCVFFAGHVCYKAVRRQRGRWGFSGGVKKVAPVGCSPGGDRRDEGPAAV